MRLGIDATAVYTSKYTGLEVFSINVVNELAKLHDDLVVWTVEDSAFSVSREKVRRVLSPVSFSRNISYQFRRPLWVESRLPSLLKQEKVDVLYTTVLSAITRCPTPHVITIQDLFPVTFPEDSPLTVRCNYRLRVPKIINNADAIVAISNFSKQQVLQNYATDAGKIHIVYAGYDTSNFTPRNDPSVLKRYGLEHKKYILAIGGIRKRKNTDRLVRSFAAIKNQISHKLVLIGPKTHAYVGHLKDLAAQCGVSDRIILINYASYQELPVLYSSAVLFTYLSLFEGFGLPILEAMACGTPVLASNTSSIPEVAGDAALLVDPSDVIAISAAMVSMLANRALLDKLSLAGMQRCHEFSWRSTAQKILEICKRHAELRLS